jgi:hypothetical protein
MLSGRGLTLAARMFLFIIALMVGFTSVSCNPSSSSQNVGSSGSTNPDLKPAAVPSKAAVEAQQKRAAHLAELKKHFTATIDEFDKTTTFRHKAFSKYMNGNGTTIEAEIVDNRIFVQSQYVSDRWIFHDDFVVKLGNEQVTASGRTQHEVVSGVVETVSPNTRESQAVAELIARAKNTPVRIRLEGKFYKDYTLRPIHQKAIAETVELWHLLSQVVGTNVPLILTALRPL